MQIVMNSDSECLLAQATHILLPHAQTIEQQSLKQNIMVLSQSLHLNMLNFEYECDPKRLILCQNVHIEK